MRDSPGAVFSLPAVERVHRHVLDSPFIQAADVDAVAVRVGSGHVKRAAAAVAADVLLVRASPEGDDLARSKA